MAREKKPPVKRPPPGLSKTAAHLWYVLKFFGSYPEFVPN